MTKDLKRNIAPEINSIESVNIPSPKTYVLSNGTEVFVFEDMDQGLLKIDFVFEDAGAVCSPKPLVAVVANAMITESTTNYSSKELADKIDYYGASFEAKSMKDYSSVSLYTLNKFLDNTLPLLQDVILNANYEQNDLDIHMARRKQDFMVNITKVDFIARQNFTKLLFGENHPYGRASVLEDYDAVNQEDLLQFHNERYKHGKHKIFVAGRFGKKELALLDSLFGTMETKAVSNSEIDWTIEPASEKLNFIKKERAVQNAIRLGFVGLKRNHEDYNGLRILTTFLGGYFGSRLMNNIREDKGYTYGIGAAHSAFSNESVFFITTEVKSEVAEDTINEIKKELLLLQNELVSDDELTTVTNYLQGSFQRQFDGSFELLERFIGINLNNLDYSYYYKYIEEVKNIDANKLQKLAKKYFDIDNFYLLNVGN